MSPALVWAMTVVSVLFTAAGLVSRHDAWIAAGYVVASLAVGIAVYGIAS